MSRRFDPNFVGQVVIVCFVLAVIFGLILWGCSPARSPISEACPAIVKIWAEAVEAEDKAGCSSDPVKLCPQIVAEFDAKIDAVPDEDCP